MSSSTSIILVESIESIIIPIRGQKILVDADLARLYGVPTKRLNEQVKRNIKRFPADFMFELSPEEKKELVANCDRFTNLHHSTVLPKAFTEHGVLMAANVLRTEKAFEVSVQIIRAFVRIRQMLTTTPDLAKKIEEIENRLAKHDQEFKDFHDLLLPLIGMNLANKRKIGFKPKD